MNTSFAWRLVVELILQKLPVTAPEVLRDRLTNLVTDVAKSGDLTDETFLKLQKDVDDVLRAHGLIQKLDTL